MKAHLRHFLSVCSCASVHPYQSVQSPQPSKASREVLRWLNQQKQPGKLRGNFSPSFSRFRLFWVFFLSYPHFNHNSEKLCSWIKEKNKSHVSTSFVSSHIRSYEQTLRRRAFRVQPHLLASAIHTAIPRACSDAMTCEGESQRNQLEHTKPSKVPSSFPSQRYSYTQLPHRLNTFLVKGKKKNIHRKLPFCFCPTVFHINSSGVVIGYGPASPKTF